MGMVTVCQPKAGYGYHSYGHQYCKEVSQETCYNKPMVMPMDVPVMVTYPEPMKSCMDKPIMLPRVSCEDIMEEKCIMVPETMDDIGWWRSARQCSPLPPVRCWSSAFPSKSVLSLCTATPTKLTRWNTTMLKSRYFPRQD